MVLVVDNVGYFFRGGNGLVRADQAAIALKLLIGGVSYLPLPALKEPLFTN